ncbi:MAG: terminase small subunit [Anaerolineae bacterium]
MAHAQAKGSGTNHKRAAARKRSRVSTVTVGPGTDKKRKRTPQANGASGDALPANAAELTLKQRAFVEHYLMCWNASEAARRAGYRTRANTAGARMMSNDVIFGLIQARFGELAMSANEILARLSDQARGSIDDFIGAGGVIDLKKARQASRMHLLHRYAVTDKGTSIELYDAQAALVQLGRHHVLFADRREITGKDGAPLPIREIIVELPPVDSEPPAMGMPSVIPDDAGNPPGDSGTHEPMAD